MFHSRGTFPIWLPRVRLRPEKAFLLSYHAEGRWILQVCVLEVLWDLYPAIRRAFEIVDIHIWSIVKFCHAE